MGEIADMMLDGTLCEGCGTYLGDETGYPGYCSACARDRKGIEQEQAKPVVPEEMRWVKLPIHATIICPYCERSVSAIGYKDHHKMKHGAKP